MRISIPQPGCCPVRLLGSRASASELLRATRDSSHAFEVFPAVDNAPPEPAVDGAVPAQPQLRQRARRQSQDLGGLTGGQRDRIVSRHQSLTTNQPAPRRCVATSRTDVAQARSRSRRRAYRRSRAHQCPSARVCPSCTPPCTMPPLFLGRIRVTGAPASRTILMQLASRRRLASVRGLVHARRYRISR